MMNQTQDQMRVDYEQLVKRVTEQDVYAHLQKGIPPSNKKVVQELEATKRNISQKLNETETLTPKAKKTLRDFNLALDSVELNLINKNRDNILQKFVYHAAQSSKKLNDALECLPKEQTDDVVRRLRTDMETLNRSLESLKDRTSDLLLGFANSSLSREILYELYRTIFNITESKLPKDEPPSVDVLNLTDDDIKLLESKLKTILEKIQDKPDVRDRLIGFIDLVDDIKSQFSSTVLKYVNDPALNQPINQPESSNPSLKAFDDEMRLAIQYFLQFLENAANGTSLNPTIESFSNLREVTMKDNKLGNELDSIGQDVKKFLKDCLSDKKFIHSEMYSSRFNFLSRKIDDVLIGQYSKEIRDLRDKLSYFLDNLANDPGMKQLSNEMTRVLNDMKIDPATADPADVLKDVYCFLTDVFPVILSGMDVIPVPRIESSDENFDLVLDNLRVCIDYIIPSKIHITSDTDLSQLKQKGVTFQERIRLTMNDIRFSAHNIAFLYNKKTGMIKTKDIGLLDLQDVVLDVDILLDFQTFVAEGRVEGVNADIAKKTLVSKSRIMVEAVDVKVSTLRMKFHNTSQDSYYTFFYPIIRMKMKSAMKSMMSDMVRDTLAKSMDPNYIRHEKNIFGSTTGVEIGRQVEA